MYLIMCLTSIVIGNVFIFKMHFFWLPSDLKSIYLDRLFHQHPLGWVASLISFSVISARRWQWGFHSFEFVFDFLPWVEVGYSIGIGVFLFSRLVIVVSI